MASHTEVGTFDTPFSYLELFFIFISFFRTVRIGKSIYDSCKIVPEMFKIIGNLVPLQQNCQHVLLLENVHRRYQNTKKKL